MDLLDRERVAAVQALVVVEHRVVNDLAQSGTSGATYRATGQGTKHGCGDAVQRGSLGSCSQTDGSTGGGALGSARERIGDTEARTEGATELLGAILGLGFGRAAARAEDGVPGGMQSMRLIRRRRSEGFRHRDSLMKRKTA